VRTAARTPENNDAVLSVEIATMNGAAAAPFSGTAAHVVCVLLPGEILRAA